jgi:peptidoglycan/LPS O-acetylase OafA/YrhL
VHIPLCDQLIVPAARALERRHVPMTIVWPAALIALLVSSLALAYVMHVVIEKPSLRVRERLAG